MQLKLPLLNYSFHFHSLAPITLSDDNEFAAIKFIHRQLDDNADGSVDFKESEAVNVIQ